jgi:hypothetical protein
MTPNPHPNPFDLLLDVLRVQCSDVAELEVIEHDPRYLGPSVRVRHPVTGRVLRGGVVHGTTSYEVACGGSSWSYVKPDGLEEAVAYHLTRWADTWRL